METSAKGRAKKKKNAAKCSRISRKNWDRVSRARASMSVDEVRVCLYTFSHLGPLLAFSFPNVRPIASKQRCGHTQPPFQTFQNWFFHPFFDAHTPFRHLCVYAWHRVVVFSCLCFRFAGFCVLLCLHSRTHNP